MEKISVDFQYAIQKHFKQTKPKVDFDNPRYSDKIDPKEVKFQDNRWPDPPLIKQMIEGSQKDLKSLQLAGFEYNNMYLGQWNFILNNGFRSQIEMEGKMKQCLINFEGGRTIKNVVLSYSSKVLMGIQIFDEKG